MNYAKKADVNGIHLGIFTSPERSLIEFQDLLVSPVVTQYTLARILQVDQNVES